MTPEEFARYISRLDEAFTRRDMATVGSFYAEGAVRALPPWGEVQGRDAIVKSRQRLLDAFSDVSWRASHADVSLKLHHPAWGGEFGFVEWNFAGTHTGTFETPYGPIAPTGNRVAVSGMTAYEFNKEGLIAEERVYFHYLSLVSQLGQRLAQVPSEVPLMKAPQRKAYLTRDEVLSEVKGLFGLVPEWLSALPEGELQHDWGLIKSLELADTAIPHKYKELIGLAVAGTLHCRYCSAYHGEMARLFGATEEEVKESSLLAKLTAGFSSYFQAGQLDFERFKKELLQIAGHVRRSKAKKAA
ncbi:MAG: ester cyclase [Chloroflexi bacterium]|nr:ester cyclase [Chloroflexota bacterium]